MIVDVSKKILIVGLGLLGGSYAKALKRFGFHISAITKDQESIDIHHASPMMKTIMELREKYDLHMRAERYSSQDEGITAADSAFIRK